MKTKMLLALVFLISLTWSVTQISECVIINESGEYIVLNDIELNQTSHIGLFNPSSNQVACIKIDVDENEKVILDLGNKTLRCADHKLTIQNKSFETVFIYIGEDVNLTIKNGNIVNCNLAFGYGGVYKVNNMKIQNCNRGGSAYYVENSKFINNTKALYTQYDGNITNNYFGHNEVALYFWGTDNNFVFGNTFENNVKALYFYHPKTDPPSGNIIVNNTFINNSFDCLAGTSGPSQYYKDFKPCKDYWMNNTTDKLPQPKSEKIFCFPTTIILMIFLLFLINSKISTQ